MEPDIDSIIRVNEDHIPQAQARRDWAIIRGKDIYPDPTYFENIETGELYSWIAGGVVWPDGAQPGYAAIIVVHKIDDETETPRFTIIEEAQSANIYHLFEACVRLRYRYGYGKYQGLMESWIGEPEHKEPLIWDINKAMVKRFGDDRGFYIRPPLELDHHDHFSTYFWRLYDLHSPGKDGQRRFRVKNCQHLIQALSTAPRNIEEVGDYRKFPVIGLVGAMLHSLDTWRPWLNHVGGPDILSDD